MLSIWVKALILIGMIIYCYLGDPVRKQRSSRLSGSAEEGPIKRSPQEKNLNTMDLLATAGAKKIGAFFERVFRTYPNKNFEKKFHFWKALCLSFHLPYWSAQSNEYFWRGNCFKIFSRNPGVPNG